MDGQKSNLSSRFKLELINLPSIICYESVVKMLWV